ncbi:hypothetical protein Tco_0430801 [Tanacetum coccineum]
MSYLVRAYYNISHTRYYKDGLCWSADLKSKTIEDIISIGSFMEVIVLNHYVLVRKIMITIVYHITTLRNLNGTLKESQRNITDHSVVVSDSLKIDYDSADESSVPETLKGITINELSSAPARGNKSSSVSKTNSAPTAKLKNVKIEDDPPLAIVMKELNELKLQISKNKSSYFRNKNSQQYHTSQSESSSRSRPSRPAMPFPSCIHCGYNNHQSDDCVYYPICEICESYDHDTHGHNRIVFLRRGIKHRNPQHIIKNCETCGSNVHTTSDHNDIEWFRKTEALQAKKAESFKASKTESSSALRSKTPFKTYIKDYLHKYGMYHDLKDCMEITPHTPLKVMVIL